MAAPKYVRAVQSFATELDGEEHLVHSGEVRRADDPVAKARPELFEPAGEQEPK